MPESGVKKKYYIFQEGNDIMFVNNVPPEELDDAMFRAFKNEVSSRGLDSIIFPNVEELVLGAQQGDVVKIGGLGLVQKDEEEVEKPEEEISLEDLPFEIVVDQDGMSASLQICDASGLINRILLEAAMEFAGVRSGIIKENIEKILNDWPKIFKIVIARGSGPVDGEDAQIQMVKDFKNNLAPEITDDGLVDFKELNLISPIEAGELLQVRIPPTPGKAGYDVYGRKIPSKPGQDRKFLRGQNTGINVDRTQLVAVKEGFLHVGSRGEINVRPVYTVNGDVDYSTGNIDYKSDVLVKGDVRAGFSVKAGGDVRIYGAVEDAVVEAEGNVIINGGILSSGTAVIKAGGDVSVGFVQNGSIDAGGSVYLRIEAIGAKISAGKDIEVIRREGRIVGGDIQAGGWVVAQVIGSDNCPSLRIRFKGQGGATESLDEIYKYCFLSTRSLESRVRIIFGGLITDLTGVDPPVTVVVKDERIQVEKAFISTDQRKKLRKKRDKHRGS